MSVALPASYDDGIVDGIRNGVITYHGEETRDGYDVRQLLAKENTRGMEPLAAKLIAYHRRFAGAYRACIAGIGAGREATHECLHGADVTGVSKSPCNPYLRTLHDIDDMATILRQLMRKNRKEKMFQWAVLRRWLETEIEVKQYSLEMLLGLQRAYGIELFEPLEKPFVSRLYVCDMQSAPLEGPFHGLYDHYGALYHGNGRQTRRARDLLGNDGMLYMGHADSDSRMMLTYSRRPDDRVLYDDRTIIVLRPEHPAVKNGISEMARTPAELEKELDRRTA